MTLEGRLVPVILLPRFTTLAGGGIPFRTFPIDIQAYEAIRLGLWRGPVMGVPCPMNFYLEESQTREVWDVLGGGGIQIAEEEETPIEVDLSKKWFRLTVVIEDRDSFATCWAQGFLVKRQE